MKNLIAFIFLILSLGVVKADPMQDLYIELMPEKFRINQPDQTLKSFKVHLLDSYNIFPVFSDVQDKNIKKFSGTQSMTGKMVYVGVFKKKYTYDVVYENGVYVFKVRIHFKNPTVTDISDFNYKIKEAQKEWNDFRIGMDFPYEFQFDLETDPTKAHYSVNILDSTRGPYDVNWSRHWNGADIAHEIGHMMGLADEYQTMTSVMDCLRESKMCDSDGQIMKHHYYFILRRLLL